MPARVDIEHCIYIFKEYPTACLANESFYFKGALFNMMVKGTTV
jgi:hypothetical protein